LCIVRGAGGGGRARRDDHRRGEPGGGQQAARALGRSGDGEDRRPGLRHPLHPAAAPGAVRAGRAAAGGRVSTATVPLPPTVTAPPSPGRRLYPRRVWAVILAAYGLVAVAIPLLHLAVPASSPLPLSDRKGVG